MPGLEFADVAAALTCEQFARRELPMRGGRAKCPWCDNPTRYNLKVDERCYCFSCHKTGDVVTLAAQVWHVSQLDAARLLNDEFRLGLCAGSPTADERQRRQRERDRRASDEQAKREAWARLCDDERAAQAVLDRFTAADADRPEFDQALRRMCAAQTQLDMMWAGVR